jgi:chitinase
MDRSNGGKMQDQWWGLTLGFMQLLVLFLLLIHPESSSAATSVLDPETSYFFAVTGYDDAGVRSIDFGIVGADDPAPPAIAITDLPESAAASGLVAISVTPPGNVEFSRVQLFANGNQIDEAATAPFAFTWDTSVLARGDYAVAVKAFDVAGNAEHSADLTVSVAGDTTPPTVSLVAPMNNSSASGSVSVSASAFDNVAVSAIELYLDGSLVLSTNQSMASYIWNTLAESNGNHVLGARAYDAAGNLGQAANLTLNVFNDTTAPVVTIASPLNNTTVGKSAVVSANASDNVAVSKVAFYLNGVLSCTATAAPYNFTWNTQSLVSGSYTLSASAYDAAGNKGQSGIVTVKVFNDKVAPTVSIASIVKSAGVATVAANASDNVGVSKVEFYVNGVLHSSSTVAPYKFTWKTLTLASGSYSLSFRAYDAAGNVGQSASVTTTVSDTTAPSVSITSPVASSTATGTLAVSASASDNLGVKRVEFYLNGALQATSTSAPYGFSWSTTALANGAYTMSAKAYDAAGNVGQSANLVLNVFNDTSAPTVSLSYPGSNGTAAGSLSVSANASDNVGVSKVEFYLNGALQATSSAAPYGFNWNTLSVVNGSYTLSARAYDAVGNVGRSANVTVNVLNDTVAPTVTLHSPTSNYVAGSNVMINSFASDNVAVTRMELYIDGTLQLTSAGGSLSVGWNFGMGLHTMTVKAYDAANNEKSLSKTVNRFF